MYNMKVAQIRTLEKCLRDFSPDELIRVTEKYGSGNIVAYADKMRITIYPNGNWKVEDRQNNNVLTKGVFGG